MKLITRESLAAGVVAKWRKQYANSLDMRWRDGPTKGETLTVLEAMGDHPNPDEVDRVIGNTSWTDIDCDDCGDTRLPSAMQVGEEPSYESSTATLCFECLRAAVARIPPTSADAQETT